MAHFPDFSKLTIVLITESSMTTTTKKMTSKTPLVSFLVVYGGSESSDARYFGTVLLSRTPTSYYATDPSSTIACNRITIVTFRHKEIIMMSHIFLFNNIPLLTYQNQMSREATS